MALLYAYHDNYLAALMTEERETRAITEVQAYGTFPTAWAERLIVLRAYVLTCLECQQAPDDLFSTKIGTYRKEFDMVLPLARAAQIAAEAAEGNAPSGGASWFTLDVQRS